MATEGTENQSSVPEDISDFYKKLDQDDEDELDINVVSYEINQTYLERLQKRLIVVIFVLNMVAVEAQDIS